MPTIDQPGAARITGRMDFVSRITRLPRAFEPDRGAEIRVLFPDLTGDMATLIVGTAGCSPYLRGLLQKEAEWLPAALDDPEQAVAAVLEGLRQTPDSALGAGLRQAKRRIALLTGLADLAGVWLWPFLTLVMQKAYWVERLS